VELAASQDSAAEGGGLAAQADAAAAEPQLDSTSASLGDAGEMLDSAAKAAYKKRLVELREDLEDAIEIGNTERAAELEEEKDALARELARAVGLGGRDRKAGSHPERARIKVTTATRSAIKKISEHHPSLGRYLTTTIKTGTFCTYEPDPRAGMSWEL
jgi:hypothetical protein